MTVRESGEMYLEAILVLAKKSGYVRSIDVSEYLGYSKPSVSRAMGILREGGYILMEKDGAITLTDSGKKLAETLQKRFDFVLGDKNTRVAKANDNYFLLLHVKTPIVIVECGFLSNWNESAMLNSEEYQDRLAWTIHMGIMEYLNGR